MMLAATFFTFVSVFVQLVHWGERERERARERERERERESERERERVGV